MNITTTSCAECVYYSNGHCYNSDWCAGTVIRTNTYTNSSSAPINPPKTDTAVSTPTQQIFVTGTRVVDDNYNYCPYCGKRLK